MQYVEKDIGQEKKDNFRDILKIIVYYHFDLFWMAETENDNCMLITLQSVSINHLNINNYSKNNHHSPVEKFAGVIVSIWFY